MRVAVVGGGASGLATAWLLDEAHHVTLFEQHAALGGHVRTAGGNVPCAALAPGVRLDTGVIEFDRRTFTAFHSWMRALGVHCPTLVGGGSTSLLLADGRHLHAPRAIAMQDGSRLDDAADALRLIPTALRRRRFLAKTGAVPRASLARVSIERFLSDDDFSTWMRSLLMYAYSTHYEHVAGLSASIAVPMLRDFLEQCEWTHIPSGVSTYVERVRQTLRGRVELDAHITGVTRKPTSVHIEREGGSVERFDFVVMAVAPHRVLALLRDASEAERSWFGAYVGGEITTLLHTDTGPYERRGVKGFTEFDLFAMADGRHGYNAYLNRLAGLSSAAPPHYSLAFDMGDEVRASSVVHRQQHDVARYSADALEKRAALLEANGTNRTFWAGAFLGDGLHEGAVRAALAIAERLGGRTLNAHGTTARPP
ncbi:MAG: NAD(P)-binding protein [Myxococcales bacterium]|nr:NAD(P)-binding protein [Myxococcales bacterium]